MTFNVIPKQFFFDRNIVSKALTKSEIRGLSRAGAFVRRTAKGLLSRTGKAPSKPGLPPRTRTGHLKDNVYFAFDENAGTVVIGPSKLNMVAYKVNRGGKLSATKGNVPGLHEFGGRQGIVETYRALASQFSKGGWVRRDLRYRKRPGERTRIRVANYPARPYMAPSLRKNLSKFPTFFYRTFSN